MNRQNLGCVKKILWPTVGGMALVILLTGNARAQTGPGNALSFDGIDDYVDVPAGIWFSGDLTVEGWVYVRSYNNWSRLLDFGNGEGIDNVLVALTDGTTGKPHFHVVSGT